MGREDRPQLLSEFGGYSFKIPENSFNLKKTYGYKKFEDQADFENSLLALYEEVFQLAGEGLSGAVYTQVSDVEDETNDLLTYDRKVLKIKSPEFKALMDRIRHTTDLV